MRGDCRWGGCRSTALTGLYERELNIDGKGLGRLSLNYCARWDDDRERTWSGTTRSLERALNERFDLKEVDILSPTRVDRAFSKIRRIVGADDFELGFLRKEQRRFDKEVYSGADVWFQFGEVPAPVDCERHYVYQDLAVEWLARCMKNDPGTFAYTGFSGMTIRAVEERARFQLAFYEDVAGVFTMGRWMADFLVDEAGLPAEKVHHVGGGINVCAVPDFGPRDGRTFIFAGRDFRRKGGDLVLEAFRILHSRDKELRLLIAGPAKNPALGQEGVEFFGDISNETLAELFAKSDCFVMPSRFEAYGLVFPEALSCALPCVGRRAFEMQHFIDDGVTGRLIDSDDSEELAEAMMDCLINSSIKQNVINEVPDVVKKYSWRAVADRIYRVIEEGVK